MLENPFIKDHINFKSIAIKNEFGDRFQNSISLFKYVSHVPYRFYDHALLYEVIDYCSDFYDSNFEDFGKYVDDNNRIISLANSNLEEINSLDYHDDCWIDDDYRLLSFVDINIHPNLLKLYEGVYKNVCHFLASISRISRGKSTEGLDLYGSIKEINEKTELVTQFPYKSTLRNGIAHGDYTYINHHIEYRDKKGNVAKLMPRDVVREFDLMTDICNTVLLAIKLFFIASGSLDKKVESFLYEEVKARTEMDEWKILNVFKSKIRNNQKQLNVHIENSFYDWNKVNVISSLTALWFEKFLNPIDRIYMTFDSKSSEYVGFTAFDARSIASLRENNYLIQDGMKTIVEDKLVFFISKYKLPKMIYYIGSLRLGFNSWKRLNTLRTEASKSYEIRNVKHHSKKYYKVIQAATIIINEPNPNHFIKENVDRIVSDLKKKRNAELSFFSLAKMKPTTYIRIYFYDRDTRKRTMNRNMRDGLIAILHYNTSGIIKDHFPNGDRQEIENYTLFWQ